MSQALDRSSKIPLYYQLQEILKEQIESGRWLPGHALPTEIELTRRFGVSRVCVRQALAILEDDREIVRIQGRGTFVAARKLAHRPVPLIRLVTDPPPGNLSVRVLDTHAGGVERNISSTLGVPAEDVLRITTLWAADGRPFGIGQTFLPRSLADSLAASITIGRDVEAGPISSRLGLELLDAEISVETTQCGQFEADLLGLPSRSTLLLTLSIQYCRLGGERRAVEVTRLGYRGDAVQLVVAGQTSQRAGPGVIRAGARS